MTANAPTIPARLGVVVLGPSSTSPTAHHIECPAYDMFIPPQPGEAGDYRGDVTDLSHLMLRWPNLVLHPCLSKAIRAYGIPAGLDHDDLRGRTTRADVLIGHVLDPDEQPSPAVQHIRALVAVHMAVDDILKPLRGNTTRDDRLLRGAFHDAAQANHVAFTRLEKAVHALAEQIGHGDVDASHAIVTLRQRPEAHTW
ncbi:hypothetical protein ACWDRB_47215 [Nonomuraea sp. NPDC003707]